MANLSAAIRQVRRARTPPEDAEPRNFDRYRPAYERILTETASLAGDEAFDELREWLVRETKTSGRLPRPDRVRSRARSICEHRDITVPSDSPLRA